jgi:fructosamine-3-kinase
MPITNRYAMKVGKQMEIHPIITELLNLNIIDAVPTEIKPLKGGTVSELYRIRVGKELFVIKRNQPKVIESEAHFLHHYENAHLLPSLKYVEPSYNYMVYTFLEGSTEYERKNKKEVLKALVLGFLNQYKEAKASWGWGWVNQPVETWQDFLLEEIAFAQSRLGSRFAEDDHRFIRNIVHDIETGDKRYLLHGDCGVHNFIFKDGQFSGIIDPSPVIGDPLYDFIYAFCSSPDELTRETIDSAVHYFNNVVDTTFLYEKVLIGLYLRLGTCVQHHPDDFEEYMTAWFYWKNIVQKEN